MSTEDCAPDDRIRIEEIICTFPSIHELIAAEQGLLAAGIPVGVMPLPDQLGRYCGMCLRLKPADYEQAAAVLGEGIHDRYALSRAAGKKVYIPWHP
ncbi:MAG: DUF3343 domain-containing protein [Treponema sp.]|jgi:hypothetical protein|nr:DUF3343 domain-containing protein [Treponema sp.]